MSEEPLWVQMQETMKLLDRSLREAKDRGVQAALKKAEYETIKASTEFAMREEGYPVTFIQDTVKGVQEVCEAMTAYNIAEVEYENAREARNVYKKKLDTLREQYSREWAEAKE